jgi:hypothetical protein
MVRLVVVGIAVPKFVNNLSDWRQTNDGRDLGRSKTVIDRGRKPLRWHKPCHVSQDDAAVGKYEALKGIRLGARLDCGCKQ